MTYTEEKLNMALAKALNLALRLNETNSYSVKEGLNEAGKYYLGL